MKFDIRAEYSDEDLQQMVGVFSLKDKRTGQNARIVEITKEGHLTPSSFAIIEYENGQRCCASRLELQKHFLPASEGIAAPNLDYFAEQCNRSLKNR